MNCNIKHTLSKLLLTGAAAIALSTAAQSATVTFNGTAPEGQAVWAANTVHSEAGYSLDIGAGAAYFMDNDIVSFPGLATFDDDVLEFNSDTETEFVMTKDDGGLFDLINVKTGSLGRDANDDGNFIFTGLFGTGGSITQTLIATASPLMTSFSGWEGLLSLTVSTTDGRYPVLDDINVETSLTVIPVPAGLPLLLTGLAALGFLHRRKNVDA